MLTLSYVQTHRFLGLILDKGLTWTPHVRQLKRKLISITQLLRFISGTTWGPSVASLIQLYNALFVGIMRYSLPVLHGMCRTNISALESMQAQALRACLGLPKCTSNVGTVAEAGAIPIGVLRLQETLRTHLRHLTGHKDHYLADIADSRSASGFAQVINSGSLDTPRNFEPAEFFSSPPWTYPIINIKTNIPGLH